MFIYVFYILILVLYCNLLGMFYFDVNEIFDGKYIFEFVRFGMIFFFIYGSYFFWFFGYGNVLVI